MEENLNLQQLICDELFILSRIQAYLKYGYIREKLRNERNGISQLRIILKIKHLLVIHILNPDIIEKIFTKGREASG